MDIFVNGPVKSHIRMIRAERLLIYFNVYKILFNDQLKLRPTRRCIPKRRPPKQNLHETMQDIIRVNLFETKFKIFQDGMAKSFVSTGRILKADGSLVPYSTNKHKLRFTIKVKPTGTTDEFLHHQNKLSVTV